jgi:hypothetical protein
VPLPSPWSRALFQLSLIAEPLKRQSRCRDHADRHLIDITVSACNGCLLGNAEAYTVGSV